MELQELRKRNRDLTYILGIVAKMATRRDMGSLLEFIVKQVTRIADAERTTLYLYNENSNELWSFIAEDLEIGTIHLKLNQGIAGYVASHKRLLNVKEARLCRYFEPIFDRKTGFHTHNSLAVPILGQHNRLIGVIQSLNKRAPGGFTTHDEFLLKALAVHIAIAIENAIFRQEKEYTLESTIHALAAAIDAKDPTSAAHSQRVTYFATKIGEAMGLLEEELNKLKYAAALHDVGKIGVGENVLLKEGHLSDEEYELVKRHPFFTREILNCIYFGRGKQDISLIASSHHERMDGKGYPQGLKGNSIPLLSRIIAVADIYEALISDRPYRKRYSVGKSLEILKGLKGHHLDPKIVDIFIKKRIYRGERRCFVRFDLNFAIDYRLLSYEKIRKKILLASHSQDISGSGMLFQTRKFIPVGSYLEVRIHLPDRDIETIARVMRCQKDGESGLYNLGVTFVNLSPQWKKKLNQYLVDLSVK